MNQTGQSGMKVIFSEEHSQSNKTNILQQDHAVIEGNCATIAPFYQADFGRIS
jgi:hypothetical protein